MNELHDLAGHKIYGRNQHGHLIGIPAAKSVCFSSATACVPKWKIEAASAASAWPPVNTSTKCCALPAPPEAITGIETVCDTAAVSSQSKPVRVPSRSMEVSKSSPAP